MAGFAALQVLKQFEVDVFHLGMAVEEYRGDENLIRIVARDDELPIYARDAGLFVGTIEEALMWLKGIEWARKYDEMIKISSDKTRANSEQKERNRQLMQAIHTGKKPDGAANKWSSQAPQMVPDDGEDVPF